MYDEQDLHTAVWKIKQSRIDDLKQKKQDKEEINKNFKKKDSDNVEGGMILDLHIESFCVLLKQANAKGIVKIFLRVDVGKVMVKLESFSKIACEILGVK